MRIPDPRYRSPLARHLPESTDLEAMKRDGWRGQHILVVAENDDDALGAVAGGGTAPSHLDARQAIRVEGHLPTLRLRAHDGMAAVAAGAGGGGAKAQ